MGMPNVATDAPSARRCAGLTGGEPCRVPPEMLRPGADGAWWCWSHDPANAHQRNAAATRGGLTTKLRARRGLDPEELPPLDSHENAEKWAATIAEAVATGRLSSAQGSTALRAVAEWRACHDAGRLVQRLAALEAKLNGRGVR